MGLFHVYCSVPPKTGKSLRYIDAMRDASSSPSSAGRSRYKAVAPAAANAAAASFALLEAELGYLNEADTDMVRSAYKFADEAHLGQFRASGEPYITHPIAVAGLCADWKLDAQAIMAALMHDAMEDCGITKTELIERFGAPTAELVDGLTKLDKLQFSTREEGQAESFRKMLLAMARDVRVILIKLADRLHNMRTMSAVVASKRARIARETLDIYAPIAHRLGLNQIYRELQDLAFAHLQPWRQAALAKAVLKARGYRRDIVERIQTDVVRTFSQAKLAVQVFGREKTMFSIYKKMRAKHLSFAQVNDVFGFRIVVGTPTECYVAMGILHQLYKPVPGRFKDYIAIPKANGYQSLHTTLVGPSGVNVEFQMRTEDMNLVAESGVAAHWLYKEHETASKQSARWARSGCSRFWISRPKPAMPPSFGTTSKSICSPTRFMCSPPRARSWLCHGARRWWTLPTPSTAEWATTRWPPASTASRWHCAQS
jgi:GTP diphosphokinase / guanosine-3',5'-bis(diphosphate) 3'-diphosphatase